MISDLKEEYELLNKIKDGANITNKEYEILREYASVGYVSFGLGIIEQENEEFGSNMVAQARLTKSGLELLEALKEELEDK